MVGLESGAAPGDGESACWTSGDVVRVVSSAIGDNGCFGVSNNTDSGCLLQYVLEVDGAPLWPLLGSCLFVCLLHKHCAGAGFDCDDGIGDLLAGAVESVGCFADDRFLVDAMVGLVAVDGGC
jgi:hypothetical protein